MEWKCLKCDGKFSNEYMESMEERIFRGKRTPDIVKIGESWYHRICCDLNLPSTGLIVRDEPIQDTDEEEDSNRKESS